MALQIPSFIKRAGRKLRDVIAPPPPSCIEAPCLCGEIFVNQRVVVVGPADTATSLLSGQEIDEYDIICRVNRGPSQAASMDGQVGTRTDVWFHCLHEDPIHGGGKLNYDIIKAQSVKYIAFPLHGADVDKYYLRARSRHRTIPIYRTAPAAYRDLMSRYKHKRPTTGLASLAFLLTQRVSELCITGFTFFKTPYMPSYRPEATSDSIVKLATASGNHAVDDELIVFLDVLKKAKNPKKITLDYFLKSKT